MDDLCFYVLFNSVSVISGRWAVDNERLCAMELRLRLRRYRLERESNSVRQISRQALNPLSYRGPVHAGSRWFDSHRRHMSERFFFRSNGPVCSELENSSLRVAIGDCSVTERRQLYQTLSNRQNCTCARKNTTNSTRTGARRRVCAAMVPDR